MFLVNSRYRHFSATLAGSDRSNTRSSPTGVHLLPKLRCHYAEFLNQGSLNRLRIFTLPTCVGLRYGRQRHSARGFSWEYGINQFVAPNAHPHPLSRLWFPVCGLSPPRKPLYRVEPEYPITGWPILLRPRSRHHTRAGTGILTCLPSPTPFGLGLGPD